jgi:threonylcarbamoyladenosine tRNA methylthiotransferase MtaB
VPIDASPNIYLLNTCTVTHIADRKCRHLLRLAHRRNPDAFIVVTGCYAQRAAAELGQIEGVSLVVGNEDKKRVVELIGINKQERRNPSPLFRTRTLLKIQDGCSQCCSYCIVPRVRGRGRDVPPEQVLAEVKARVVEDYKEVVLTGTQIGDYGADGGLEGLVQRILAETEVERLRLSSLQPQNLSPQFLKLWRDSRLCRHLHLPLQSGSDAVLRRMRRRYSTAEYERAVAMAEDALPDLAVTTDVMVGFPGESEEEFAQSLRFCERMSFSGLHIFPYSPRPGTAAANMPDQVDERVKKVRSEAMLELAQKSAQTFRRRFLGRRLTVLWEGSKNGIWSGLTNNYLRVFAQSEEKLSNRLLPATLVEERGQGLWGSLAKGA